jgi:hypothetical protein
VCVRVSTCVYLHVCLCVWVFSYICAYRIFYVCVFGCVNLCVCPSLKHACVDQLVQKSLARPWLNRMQVDMDTCGSYIHTYIHTYTVRRQVSTTFYMQHVPFMNATTKFLAQKPIHKPAKQTKKSVTTLQLISEHQRRPKGVTITHLTLSHKRRHHHASHIESQWRWRDSYRTWLCREPRALRHSAYSGQLVSTTQAW